MPDSLKNMLKSVDWSKMVSGNDARNALVGSALGGLMLGGASLMQDRDPEESKMAPVGDALMGALLGGAAGYGIPKGLALFRNSGGLAPDDDQVSGSGVGGAAAAGAAAGAVGGPAMLAVKDAPAAYRAWRRLIRNNADTVGIERLEAIKMLAQQKHLRAQLAAAGKDTAQVDGQIKNIVNALRKEIPHDFWSGVRRSFNPGTIVNEMPNDPGASTARGLSGLFKFTNGKRYAGRTGYGIFGKQLRYTPRMRHLLRNGKYGLIGALLAGGTAAAGSALFGSNSRDNFAK